MKSNLEYTLNSKTVVEKWNNLLITCYCWATKYISTITDLNITLIVKLIELVEPYNPPIQYYQKQRSGKPSQ